MLYRHAMQLGWQLLELQLRQQWKQAPYLAQSQTYSQLESHTKRQRFIDMGVISPAFEWARGRARGYTDALRNVSIALCM